MVGSKDVVRRVRKVSDGVHAVGLLEAEYCRGTPAMSQLG